MVPLLRYPHLLFFCVVILTSYWYGILTSSLNNYKTPGTMNIVFERC